MKQLALDIGLATGPALGNYFAGANEAALQHLRLWVGQGSQQATRAPAFVRRAEIRRRQARHLAQEIVKTGKAVRQAHGGWER